MTGRPPLPHHERTVTVAVSIPRWLLAALRAEAGTGSVSAIVTRELSKGRSKHRHG